MSSLRRLLSLRWVLTSLLVLAAAGVMARLGIWQLDRLEWRRAFNARVGAQINAPELDLNQHRWKADDLFDMEYRAVTVQGEYDFSQQVLLRNQAWEERGGYRLLTPLRTTDGEMAVLVDRGWIPLEEAQDLSVYDEPGVVTVRGQIRRPQTRPDFGGVPDPTLAPGETRLAAWNIVNLERIQQQVPYALLPVYIQQAPDPSWTALPYRGLAEVELTEGSHQSYAMQWFAFAGLLLAGYPFFVRQQLRQKPDRGADVQADVEQRRLEEPGRIG